MLDSELFESVLSHIGEYLGIPSADISLIADSKKQVFRIKGKDDIVVRYSDEEPEIPGAYESVMSEKLYPLRKSVKISTLGPDKEYDISERALPLGEFNVLLIKEGYNHFVLNLSRYFKEYIKENFNPITEFRVWDDFGIVGYVENNQLNYYIVLLDLSYMVENYGPVWSRMIKNEKSKPLNSELIEVLESIYEDELKNIVHIS